MVSKVLYKRVLLKVSGEALQGKKGFGVDPAVIKQISSDIVAAVSLGVSVNIVVGGGNIFRGGSDDSQQREKRITGDHIGMLATVINALNLKNGIIQAGCEAVVLSAIEIPKICESFSQRALKKYMSCERVIIFAGGTGNPFFTTDTAAALRAAEIDADALLKATQVNGIYSSDPVNSDNAKRFDVISYSQILHENLKIMDAAAVSIARDNNIPILVFCINEPGGLLKILQGTGVCTTVKS